ncbi:uncharacterized protein ACA1_097520 [Acanthamoeba castellanii str. Neff]|uniref:Uncharacterized protein n=1 Tax=Acanthamoeba castellanii (strain ATCC 30010 / Neff) TaxID=1257118 RepID=L8GJ79_ACACF|nr:uncharacterized protein ACA1_097520 [Acanthamoeba castellanii str. Neff]ELR13067.1 hypothetical protein ACA1_097520 [Acanthamoeba castellanii str. Neff]
MAFDFKVIIAAGVLMAAHALCFILWISGWGASKQLESKEAGGADPSQPFVYYFVWGLFMSLTIMATTVVSALVPWSLAKRVAHLATIFFIILFIIPLSFVMGQTTQQFTYSDCGDLSGDAKDMCNGFKTVFVSTFFYMFVLAGKFIFAMVLYQRETVEGDSNFRQSFDRT